MKATLALNGLTVTDFQQDLSPQVDPKTEKIATNLSDKFEIYTVVTFQLNTNASLFFIKKGFT